MTKPDHIGYIYSIGSIHACRFKLNWNFNTFHFALLLNVLRVCTVCGPSAITYDSTSNITTVVSQHFEMLLCSFFIFVAFFLAFFSFYLLSILRSFFFTLLEFTWVRFLLSCVCVIFSHVWENETIRNTSWMNKYWNEKEKMKRNGTFACQVEFVIIFIQFHLLIDWLICRQLKCVAHGTLSTLWLLCSQFFFLVFLMLGYNNVVVTIDAYLLSFVSTTTFIHMKFCVSLFTH